MMSEATMFEGLLNQDEGLELRSQLQQQVVDVVETPPPAQGAIEQSISEIQSSYPPAPAPANQIQTPEARAVEQGAPLEALALHGATNQVAPVQQAVAEVQQTVAETAPVVLQEQQQAQQQEQVNAVQPQQEPQQPTAAEATTQAPAPQQDARWDRARRYNMMHSASVEAFNQATGGSCLGADGEVDAARVAEWQAAHGLAADGMIGPLTAGAGKQATKAGPAPEIAAPAQQQGPADDVAPVPPPKSNPDRVGLLTAQYGGLLRQYVAGVLDRATVITMMIAYDKELHGGVPSVEGTLMVQSLMTDLQSVAPQQPAPQQEQPQQQQQQQGPAPLPIPAAALVQGQMHKKVYEGGSEEAGLQKCLVFVSAGELTATPDIFLFFHGHGAQYGIDDAQDGKKGSASGSDVAGEAMQQARGKNVIAILPQGVVGGSVKGDKGANKRQREGGHMKALQAGLPTFLSSILSSVAVDLDVPKLSPGNISIAGHSAGGYQGVHDALEGAGDLIDHITDLTLMDSSYSSAHFSDAADWMFAGKAGKSLRIIGSPDQIKSNVHGDYFGKSSINARAKKGGFEVEHLDTKGDDRDNKTKVVQHSHIKKDGVIHGDVLILASARTHHQIRDDVMDDAILSIGEGAAGSAGFAEHDIKNPEEAQQGGAETVVPITAQDLDAQVEQMVPGAPVQQQEQDPQQHEPVAPQPIDGLIQEPLQQKAGQLEVDGPSAGLDEQHKAWLHNTKDATSVFPPKLKDLYDDCVAKAKKGTLIFPAKDEPAGKSSAPFKKFLKALYDHFNYDERRINMEIIKKGGKKAYDIEAFLESQVVPVEGQKAKLHHKAADAFGQMRAAALQDGVELTILSSYREPKNKVSSNPYAVASNSSHSYGLAMDLRLSVDAADAQDGEAFGVKEITTGDVNNLMKYYKSSVTKWMLLNGAKFNFFPYMNEPWHYEFNPEGMADEIIQGAKAFKKSK